MLLYTFSVPSSSSSLWSFIPLLTSLLFFFSSQLTPQPHIRTQWGIDIPVFLFFSLSASSLFLTCNVLGLMPPQPRLEEMWNEQVRCCETITAGCRGNPLRVLLPYSRLCECVCKCVSAWNYGCPWDRSQPLKLQTAFISTSKVAKKNCFHSTGWVEAQIILCVCMVFKVRWYL